MQMSNDSRDQILAPHPEAAGPGLPANLALVGGEFEVLWEELTEVRSGSYAEALEGLGNIVTDWSFLEGIGQLTGDAGLVASTTRGSAAELDRLAAAAPLGEAPATATVARRRLGRPWLDAVVQALRTIEYDERLFAAICGRLAVQVTAICEVTRREHPEDLCYLQASLVGGAEALAYVGTAIGRTGLVAGDVLGNLERASSRPETTQERAAFAAVVVTTTLLTAAIERVVGVCRTNAEGLCQLDDGQCLGDPAADPAASTLGGVRRRSPWRRGSR
jgi:hypothetical protein